MSQVYILPGFDTEAPRAVNDPCPEQHQIEERKAATLNAIDGIKSVFLDKYDSSVTFFLVGSFLEKMVELEGRGFVQDMIDATDKRIDIQSHSQSHLPFRAIPGMGLPVLNAGEVKEDIQKSAEIIGDIYGVQVIGIRAPFGYLNGLSCNLDLVTAVKEAGMEYVSSDLRGRGWSMEPHFFDDVGELRQPYILGNGNLREIPSIGFQDYAFTNRDGAPEHAPKTPETVATYLINLIDQALAISSQLDMNIFLPLCMHPQDMNAYDSKLLSQDNMLKHALSNGVKVISYTDANEMLKKSE
jgi:peptidoglycan/xylan/chitin deacetylase (PgdA/CDA1 family)